MVWESESPLYIFRYAFDKIENLLLRSSAVFPNVGPDLGLTFQSIHAKSGVFGNGGQTAFRAKSLALYRAVFPSSAKRPGTSILSNLNL